MKLGPSVLRDLVRASAYEWVLADGLGGYASSTVIGLNTRRYHGLLVAASRPPLGRTVLLSRLDEGLLLGGRRHALATSLYPGAVHPRGFESARTFALDPLPSTTWDVGEATLTRTVARIQGAPATVVSYLLEGGGPGRLEIRPLLAYRSHHALQRENDHVRANARREDGDFALEPYEGALPLHLRLPGAQWVAEAYWYRNNEYERERGFDSREDLWSPGFLSVPIAPGRTLLLLASAGPMPASADAGGLLEGERRRLRLAGGGFSGLLGTLRRAASAFVVRRGEGGSTVLAGYPWPGECARDAMAALPGLCLAGGRTEQARGVIEEWSRHLQGGLLPGRLPREGEGAERASADAALWMVIAIHRYLEATGDRTSARARLKEAVFSVVDGYRAGAGGITVRADGLLAPAESGSSGACMDEGAWRPGPCLAVEVQALWYNALVIGAELARDGGERERAASLLDAATRARRAFLRAFWSEEKGYLADAVDGQSRDFALRPSQLYAIALPHALLPRDKAVRVMARVKQDLLTPVGLRTLAPWDPAYVGGEAAACQGAAWPFLMGAYFDAAHRLFGEAAKRECWEWLAAFSARVEGEAALGQVSERFDGEAPHAPRGAIAHAWGVGELLRVAMRLGDRRSPTRVAAARPSDRPQEEGAAAPESQDSPDQHISQKRPS